MAAVYIANPSRSNRVIPYRVPEVTQLRQITIPPLRQAKFPEDFEGQALESIVEQIERAGGVRSDDLRALTHPHSLVYTIARAPMKSDDIDGAVERDVLASQNRAAEKSEEAGLAGFATIAAANPDALKAASLEVVQMKETPGSGDEAERNGVDLEVRVDRAAGKKKTSRKRE